MVSEQASAQVRRRALAVGVAVGAAAALGGCTTAVAPAGAAATAHAHRTASPSPVRRVAPPVPGVAFDYQIGGGYPPAAGVRAVSRDRGADPVPGLYNVCYVNAFQAQPDALPWWRSRHPDLLLRDGRGGLVMDRDWNEALLDVSTPAKRTALASVVGGWIDGCARRGFQAVEPDNLDSYTRSGGRLTGAQNAAYAHLLAVRAHAAGLAIGQKNTTGLLGRRRAVGFDFAVAEECGRYDECGQFASAYGDRVFVIEYDRRGFAAACRTWARRLSVVLRDRDVSPAGAPGHVFASC